MAEDMQAILLTAFEQSQGMDSHDRLSNLLFLTLVSPQYAVQR